MTESEAKTKWCPMTRRVEGMDGNKIAVGQAAFNRVGYETTEIPYGKCIGSACMMWRAHTESKHVDLVGDWAGKVNKLVEEGFNTFTLDPSDPNAVVERKTKHGYCGLAGLSIP